MHHWKKSCLLNQLIIVVSSSPPKTIVNLMEPTQSHLCLAAQWANQHGLSISFQWHHAHAADPRGQKRTVTPRCAQGRALATEDRSFSMDLLSSLLFYRKVQFQLFVLSFYHLTRHRRIRKQQAGSSSTWKILATLKKLHHSPSAYRSWISPRYAAFPFLVFFHLVFISPVCLWSAGGI